MTDTTQAAVLTNERKVIPRPPDLPKTREDLDTFRAKPFRRSLNDMVEDGYRALYEDAQFQTYLWATHDGNAETGSLSWDDHEAVRMIIAWAMADGDYAALVSVKPAVIGKCLRVVLARYQQSRKERRYMVGGKIVPNDNDD